MTLLNLLNKGLLYQLLTVEGVFLFDWQVAVYWAVFFACLITAYLLGSVNSAVIVSRVFHGEDIRKFGSGNAGMTNIMRTYGKKEAGLTLFGDIAKMGLSLLLAGFMLGFAYNNGMSMNFQMYIVGIACMMGHIKPIFYSFKGGKGVLCYAMMGLILAPVPFLFVLACFFLIVLVSKYISLGSVVCAAFFPIALQGYMQIFYGGRWDGLIFLTSLVASAILIICHRSNLVRLYNHTENKFSLKKKNKTPSAEAEKTKAENKSAAAPQSDNKNDDE